MEGRTLKGCAGSSEESLGGVWKVFRKKKVPKDEGRSEGVGSEG